MPALWQVWQHLIVRGACTACCGTACSVKVRETTHARVQIGLNYALAHNEERYERSEDARSHINFVIGQWQLDNGLSHSQSLQPGFTLAGVPAAMGGSQSA